MHAIEEQIVLFLQQLFQTIGWTGVVIAMAIESACIPLPSEIVMPLAGWMLVQAQGYSPWHTAWAGFFGALGCTIGSVLTYWFGAKGGRPILLRYGKYILISKHDIYMADRWFERYGESTAFFSRLMPIVRTFISLPAGVARMNFPRFVVLTFVGSFLWCWGLAYAGYVFGEHWREVREIMRPFDIPIAIALLALAAWYIYRHVKRFNELEKE
ncbi:MAG: DedA family protein [Anaerolineae bacterium]|nr:DedA family protein [Anaerolineae bacterium]MDW8103042.1 DedA family protein [Anaerolineae bacterium]